LRIVEFFLAGMRAQWN